MQIQLTYVYNNLHMKLFGINTNTRKVFCCRIWMAFNSVFCENSLAETHAGTAVIQANTGTYKQMEYCANFKIHCIMPFYRFVTLVEYFSYSVMRKAN